MTEAILAALCVVLAALVAGLAVALWRLSARAAADLAAVRAEQETRRAELERRVEALEGSRDSSPRSPAGFETLAGASSSTSGGEYVITRIGDDGEVEEVVAIVAGERPDARLFADLVLRETVVKAASVAYGVRRGLSPEHRNKMWFEMRREVRRARKQRRADLKQAQREWKARERAGLEDDAGDHAA